MKEITDTDRLDFLIEYVVPVPKIGRFYSLWKFGKNHIGNTPRDAIDAAIKSQEQKS